MPRSHQRPNLQPGDIGAVKSSINHPLLRYLKDCQTFQLSEIASQAVESTFDGVTTMNPDNLKLRPCLYIRERKALGTVPRELIFLMGTLEGKKKLDIDAFTRDFVIPISPTPGHGEYCLKSTPPWPKRPAYLIAYPLARGDSNPIRGQWRHQSRHPITQETETTTYRVGAEELALFENACAKKLKQFSKRSNDFKEHAIQRSKQILCGFNKVQRSLFCSFLDREPGLRSAGRAGWTKPAP
ncbi:hypothetical protein BDN72DRAFT_878682 [Pluteus cervinus]|uniref:Uncharacterized protein n=1 Tax=Pluteus cervinus TaxID=181527 RepID=A0ACD3ATN1_9AGAR|nr:hypothetical protein BDN72DRAFT_878682 [Pluteus cervinus]